MYPMRIPKLRYFIVLVLLLAFFVGGQADDKVPVEKDGTLLVFVKWGDLDKTPANDVYIEAHGFVQKYRSQKSFVLKMSYAGRYELPIPPGVYDVLVSEGISIPVCKRVLIRAGSTTDWSVNLEMDHEYTQR
jgi:hypothetical protein